MPSNSRFSWVRAGLVLTVAALVSAQSAEAAVSSPSDAAALFEKATAAGDVEAIASLYAPDAVLLAPGGQTITGRDAIRTIHRNNQAAGANAIRFGDVKADVGEDRAVVLWSWTLRISPQGRPPTETKGRSLVYWRRTQDGWHIVLDMFQTLPH